jgi:2-iminobutanoate/2-iminopropanoate deaminase
MPAEGLKMLRPESFGPPRASYSAGVLATGPTEVVYLAGQTPTAGDGSIVGGDDVVAQTHTVFENIRAVLAEAGMDFSNVVKFTNYLVSADLLPGFRTARNELWPELFPDGDFPADTLLVISRLARPEFLVEIDTVAVRC